MLEQHRGDISPPLPVPMRGYACCIQSYEDSGMWYSHKEAAAEVLLPYTTDYFSPPQWPKIKATQRWLKARFAITPWAVSVRRPSTESAPFIFIKRMKSIQVKKELV